MSPESPTHSGHSCLRIPAVIVCGDILVSPTESKKDSTVF